MKLEARPGSDDLDEAESLEIVGELTPFLRAAARQISARTGREERDVLELVGLSALSAAGWRVLALAEQGDSNPMRYL